MKRSQFLVAFLSVSILIFFVLSIAANTDDSQLTVRGQILDRNQAVVVGADVTATRTTDKASVVVTSNNDGEFTFTLTPGDYILEVSASGFISMQRKLRVSPDSQEDIVINLEIASASATVTVTDGGEYLATPITSATKTFTALRDIPQSVSIVGKQQIADQLITNLGDFARYQPGITSHQGENNRDQLIIRGQSSSADFYVDGVRDDAQYQRDLYNLERIETLRGPNALSFGRGGGGGVINRVTKEAEFDSLYQGTLQGGSYGNKRATFDIDQKINAQLAIRVNGLGEDSDSFRDFVEMRRYGFNPTATIKPDVNTRITLAYDFFRDRHTADRGITSFQTRPADVPLSTFYGDPENSKVRLGADIFSAGFERVFGSLIFRNRFVYGDYDRFYQNYVPGSVNAAKTLVSISAYNNRVERKNVFNQSDLVYAVTTGKIKHTFLGGFELGRQRTTTFRNTGFFNDSATSVQVPYDNPLVSTPTTFRQSSSDGDNRTNLVLASAYVQDQVELSRYVQVLGGLRFDYFDLKFHNNRTNVAVTDFRRIDQLVSPRIGIVVKPVEQLSIYGSYSVSYLPSSGDQFSSLAANTETLKPEKFQNYEFGVKWEPSRNLSITSAVYRLDRTNTRANDPNRPGFFITTGSQRTNGLELGVNGNPTRKWTVSGGYAYQDSFISSTTTSAFEGARVGQVPHHSFTIWNKYQIVNGLSAGLGIISRSDMFAAIQNPVVPPAVNTTTILPSYTRADAAVFYTFNEHWRLQANFENLFDKRYYQNADNNTNISPGSPRATKIALNVRF